VHACTLEQGAHELMRLIMRNPKAQKVNPKTRVVGGAMGLSQEAVPGQAGRTTPG
jgi:hypothetical protein